jgi:hypothetical protein
MSLNYDKLPRYLHCEHGHFYILDWPQLDFTVGPASGSFYLPK